MVIYFEILIFNTLGSRPARIYGFNDSTAVLAHSRGAGGQLTPWGLAPLGCTDLTTVRQFWLLLGGLAAN